MISFGLTTYNIGTVLKYLEYKTDVRLGVLLGDASFLVKSDARGASISTFASLNRDLRAKR